MIAFAKKNRFLLGLCSLLLSSAIAQPGPFIRNIPPAEYQANNQNWAMAFDHRGIVYIGNNAGLLEGDGLSWTLHELPKRQTARSVAADSSRQRIYTGGYGEFGYWERTKDGQLIYHSLSQEQLTTEEKREEFWHILPTARGVFFQSFSVLFFWDGSVLTRLNLPGNIMYLQQVNDQLLLPVIDRGIYELHENGNFEQLPGSDVFADKTISGMFCGPNDRLWVGTEKAGIFQYVNNQFIPWSAPINDRLKKYQLNKSLVLQDGRLAFGTILAGLFVTNPDGRVEQHIQQENGLQDNTILSLGEDARGNIWLGLDRGIDLVDIRRPLSLYSDRDGRIGSVYDLTVFQDRLYLATNRGVFYRSWPWRDQERFILIEGSQGQSWRFFSAQDQLLFGHNEGTFRIAGERVEKISSVTGGWYFQPVDDDTTEVLQGCYTGLVRLSYRPDSGGWVEHGRIRGISHRINKIIAQGQDTFWLQSLHEGIFRVVIDWPTNQVKEWVHYNAERGLPLSTQTFLQQQHDTLLVQVDHRLFRYVPSLDTFVYARLSEQANRSSVPIAPDLKVNVFPELIDLAFADGRHQIFPFRMVPQFERIRFLEDSLLAICLDNGFAILRLDQARQMPPTDRTPFFKQVSFINNRGLRVDVDLREAVLKIPPGYNQLTVRMGHTTHTEPGWLRYRLLPKQTSWSDWEHFSGKTFFNLSPGNYQLEVASLTAPRPATLAFQIQRHWYQTPWVAIPYLLGISSLFYLLYRWHTYRLSRQQKKLEAERERQLQRERMENRNRALQQDVIRKNKELANSTFNLIRKNELLIEIRDHIQQLQNSPHGNARYGKVLRLINRQINHQDDWEIFEKSFNQVHEAFFQKLVARYPDLTPGDLKLAACLKMNLSSKEIAPLLNISLRGVENKRYRLRKKLDLPSSENLTEFMINL